MGASVGRKLGFAPAIEGEHPLAGKLLLYHRTEMILFSDDTFLDADQGLEYRWSDFGVKLGYRLFAGLHLQRSGPRLALTWRFSSPKIPFLFPSLG